jgi:hypothetical protein
VGQSEKKAQEEMDTNDDQEQTDIKKDLLEKAPNTREGKQPLTAETIAAMDEKVLRKYVLIPLLCAMGWKEVREGHGASELGKDIIGWKTDDNGQRIDCAVVAKAVPLNGQAAITNRRAGGVAIQVLQCFGSPFPDPTTGREINIGYCLAITNKPITQTASDAFWSVLNSTNILMQSN